MSTPQGVSRRSGFVVVSSTLNSIGLRSANIFSIANQSSVVPSAKATLRTANDDAVKVSLSENLQRAPAKRNENVIETAKDFVSTAQSAVNAISALLREAEQSVGKIEKTTNSREKLALAEESQLLLEEIDSIVAAAKSNDEPVINAGNVTFATELSPGAQPDSNDTAIVVKNIAISASDLGLADYSSETVINDPEGAIEQLTTARMAVASSGTALSGTSQEIATVEGEIDQRNEISQTALDQNESSSQQPLSSTIANQTSTFVSQNKVEENVSVKNLINLSA